MKTIKINKPKIGREIKLLGHMNHYLAWIANLGVVPLFLFCAFLFAPAFFFFASLLFVVTRVLETIFKLLSYRFTQKICYFKESFLPVLGLSVKVILLTSCTQIFFFHTAMAQDEFSDTVMTKGEIKSFNCKGLKNYTVSNKEVLKYQFNQNKSELIIKAKSIGHSIITINFLNGKKKEINILVMNKNLDAKMSELTLSLKNLAPVIQNNGQKIKISGELNNATNFFTMQKLINENQKYINNQTQVNSKTKNEIIGLIYEQLLRDNIESIKCDFNREILYCTIADNEKISESYQKLLEDNFGIKLIQNIPNLRKNFEVKIKLFQLEQLDGEEIRLGLEQLNTSIRELIKSPITKIIEKNNVALNSHHINLSTLAEPQLILGLRNDSVIQIGSETPFINYDHNKNTSNTDWKFAGLKIKLFVDKIGDKLKINYETELSKPSDQSNSISGSKEMSSVILALNSPTKLFQITLKTQGKNTEAMPFLSKIPILGELFKSKTNSDNFKTLTAIIEVTEND